MTLTRAAACLVLGMLPLLILPQLPSPLALAALIALALLLLQARLRPLRQAALMLLGFTWVALHAQREITQIEQLIAQPATLQVRVVEAVPDDRRMTVQLLWWQGRPVYPPLYARVGLRGGGGWCAGMSAIVTLSLRPVHAQLNEGGFDAQRWALANHTPLTGRILTTRARSGSCDARTQLIQRAEGHYAQAAQPALLSALAFGDRRRLTGEQRQLLRETGTAHLMAISGMHIGLAAAFGALLGRLCQLPLPAWRIGYRWPLYCAALTALAYAWLSGGQPPAQRALVAIGCWTICRLRGWHVSGTQVWLLCVALVLLVDPLTLLADSFWLSVLAVAAMLLGYWLLPLPATLRRYRCGRMLQLVHLQLIIMLLLLPAQLWLFHGLSLSALAANLIAVPLVSLLVVPLILLALLLLPCPALSTLCWRGADLALNGAVASLRALPPAWYAVSGDGALGLVMGLLLLIALYLGASVRWPVALLILPLAIAQLRASDPSVRWRLDMLDVGHGLAVVLSRHGHALLYDSGGSWSGGDAGERTIVPWLEWQGLRPDMLVLSHAHRDHIGGAASLLLRWPDLMVRRNFAPAARGCSRGDRWRWQGLDMEVVWPPAGAHRGDNNDSCALLIHDGTFHVLLTGDMEREAERQLVAEWGDRGAVDVLQVPHHGSRTSSTPVLLRRLRPTVALASAARYSPWRLPAASVVARYRSAGIAWYDTAVSGQIAVTFYRHRLRVSGLREQILPRWYHPWFGVPRDSR